MHLKIEAEGKKRRVEISELQDRMKSHIVTLVEDHDRALRGAEEFYSASQKKLLEDQKLLKVRHHRVTRPAHHIIAFPCNQGRAARGALPVLPFSALHMEFQGNMVFLSFPSPITHKGHLCALALSKLHMEGSSHQI